MHAARFIQAVILMLLLALAASCASSRQYIATVFPPRNAAAKPLPVRDSSGLRFLAIDTASEKADWVNDWIGKDSTSGTAGKSTEPSVQPGTDQPVVAKIIPAGSIRNKRKRD